MMERNKISQMDAFLIETVRANGVSNQGLWQQVKEGDVNDWEIFNSKLDFTGLVNLYQRGPEVFSSILVDGYTLKFVTIKGIQKLLKLKFDIEADTDSQQTEYGLASIPLTKEQLAEFKEMLSPNWIVHIEPTNGDISILQSYVFK